MVKTTITIVSHRLAMYAAASGGAPKIIITATASTVPATSWSSARRASDHANSLKESGVERNQPAAALAVRTTAPRRPPKYAATSHIATTHNPCSAEEPA